MRISQPVMFGTLIDEGKKALLVDWIDEFAGQTRNDEQKTDWIDEFGGGEKGV